MTRIATILQALFLSQVMAIHHGPIVQKWVIDKGSSLYIQGRSNVSSFRCDIIEYLHPDTIRFCRDEPGQQEFAVKGGIAIDVNRFDCHHRMMTSDLKKMLKAGEHPKLKIDLLTLGYHNDDKDGQGAKGKVAIELAGITRCLDVDYTLQVDGSGYLHLYGERQVQFSDFGLTPPRKAGGLIRVQSSITVRFELILRAIPA